jgi:hypothetical protein
MILLTATTEILELLTTAATSTDYYISYVDVTTTTFVPGQSNGNIAAATTTTILAAPAASTQRQVKFLSVRNRSATASQTVTIKHDTSGTERYITADITLGSGETLEYNDGTGFIVRNRNGQPKQEDTTQVGYSGICLDYYKIGTASEAVGVKYGFAKDSGLPGAWVPGVPGLNGWWVDATQATNAANPAGATQAGCYQLQNPASGSWYLNDIGITTSVAHLLEVYDLVWYNTGTVVTTLIAQAITMPAASKPERDLYGTTNGEGWIAGIYVTTATTNAGAITNTTISYTNSDGTAGRTGTISSFPATAVLGTFVPFQLAAGDRGIRSIESITLGTSYVAGAISVVLLRKIASVPNPVANVGGIMNKLTTDPTGVKLYSGTALFFTYISSATTATSLGGSIQLINR